MAVQLDDIQTTFLAFLQTHPDGGTRPAVVSALVSGGATSGQAGGALTAIQQAAMDIGAVDANTYGAFMTRFAALSGAGRGLVMATAACEYARRHFLVTADIDAKLDAISGALATTIPNQQAAVANARSAVSGAGFGPGVSIVLAQLFTLGDARIAAVSGALANEQQRLTELRGA